MPHSCPQFKVTPEPLYLCKLASQQEVTLVTFLSQHVGLFQALWSQQQELARASQLVLSSWKIAPVPALSDGIMFLLQGMAVFHCVCFSNLILLF